MEQFYYLSETFLKARFNVSKLYSYVLIEYSDGKKRFISFGQLIKSARMQNRLFIDLRRGKLCNPYVEAAKRKCCNIIGQAFVSTDSQTRNITVTDQNRAVKLQLNYNEIEKVYKDSWFTTLKIVENPLCPPLNPFGRKEFFARHFNVDFRRLAPRIIFYSQEGFSLGFEYQDEFGYVFLIDIFKDTISKYDGDKFMLFKTTDTQLFKICVYQGKPGYYVETEERSEVNSDEPLVKLNFLQTKLDDLYRTSWYSRNITRRGWTKYRQVVFS